MKRLIFLFLLLVTTHPVWGSYRIWNTETCGIVTYEMSAMNEEGNKMRIAVQLINRLSEEAKNKLPVRIRFQHHSSHYDYPAHYLIRYEKDENNHPGLIIEVEACSFNITQLLQLAEFGMKNGKKLEKWQKLITITLPFNEEKEILTVPEETISSLWETPLSGTVTKVLQQKIYRPEEGACKTSYYLQNGRFYIYRVPKEYAPEEDKEEVLLELADIHQFIRVEGYTGYIFVFNTPFTFRFIGGKEAAVYQPRNIVSREQTIPDTDHRLNYTYKISSMGEDKICIMYRYNKPKDEKIKRYFDEPDDSPWRISRMGGWTRNMIYLVNNDCLIPNADDLIDNAAKEILGIKKETGDIE